MNRDDSVRRDKYLEVKKIWNGRPVFVRRRRAETIARAWASLSSCAVTAGHCGRLRRRLLRLCARTEVADLAREISGGERWLLGRGVDRLLRPHNFALLSCLGDEKRTYK
jgi:hypothetical protein